MSSRKSAITRSRALRKPVEADLGFAWGRLNSLLLGLGVTSLIVGYVLLARGSITLAPVLLVAGYCGFIPTSLVLRRRSEGTGE
jgi:hypothetical protein